MTGVLVALVVFVLGTVARRRAGKVRESYTLVSSGSRPGDASP